MAFADHWHSHLSLNYLILELKIVSSNLCISNLNLFPKFEV